MPLSFPSVSLAEVTSLVDLPRRSITLEGSSFCVTRDLILRAYRSYEVSGLILPTYVRQEYASFILFPTPYPPSDLPFFSY
jgi:hypothetical protein